MQLVFPDDEAVQPHLKLLAMAKRWKKGQEEVTTTTTNENTENNDPTTTTTGNEDPNPLPESAEDERSITGITHVDDEREL